MGSWSVQWVHPNFLVAMIGSRMGIRFKSGAAAPHSLGKAHLRTEFQQRKPGEREGEAGFSCLEPLDPAMPEAILPELQSCSSPSPTSARLRLMFIICNQKA